MDRTAAPLFRSKIQTIAAKRKGLGCFGDLGPGRLATDEWQARGLELPDVAALRRYRLDRVVDALGRADVAAILLSDPINVRYATDSTNMQVWCTHNRVRYALVCADGHVVVFDFHGSSHLSDHLGLVKEIRPATAWTFFLAGESAPDQARAWAAEIDDILRDRAGDNRRLALDTADMTGIKALRDLGVEPLEGQHLIERARVIKSVDEIRAMRCALDAKEAAMAVMEAALTPGISEQELWAILHKEAISRGGEWIETRLLASGPRTNPWFQECSSRVIEEGDVVAFDTDLIGPYGYCADISRSWVCGDVWSAEQKELYAIASDQIETNAALVTPGLSFREFADQAFQLPEDCVANRYSAIAHGVGLCDEYPHIGYPMDREPGASDDYLEAGMTICIESYVGRVGGREGIKLEQQVLVTEAGSELLSTYRL
ncbi:MAG: M24 family metallopeptidase [Geminicoccaceae bacterium]